jgi:hypothetical protein
VYGEAYYFGDGSFLKIIVLPAPGPIKMRDQKRSVREISRELEESGVVATSWFNLRLFCRAMQKSEKTYGHSQRRGLYPAHPSH